jgi:hypothetical protein
MSLLKVGSSIGVINSLILIGISTREMVSPARQGAEKELLQGATPVVENVTEIVRRNGVETEITYPDTVAWTIKADKFKYR